MDRLKKYRKIIKEECSKLDNYINSAQPHIRYYSLVDSNENNFISYAMGWNNRGIFVHDLIYHVEIIDGKIWIHFDSSDEDIRIILIEKGIDKSLIVITQLETLTPSLAEN